MWSIHPLCVDAATKVRCVTCPRYCRHPINHMTCEVTQKGIEKYLLVVNWNKEDLFFCLFFSSVNICPRVHLTHC